MQRRKFLVSLGLGTAALGLNRTNLFAGGCATADVAMADATEHRLKELFTKASKLHWQELAIGEIMVLVGRELLGTPYVGATLEAEGPEQVQINLEGLDCVTFFENCLAFARCLKQRHTDMKSMKEQIGITRYRDGQLSGYTSRLHYTAEWISNNEAKRVVKNITQELGAEVFDLHVDFMSKHPQYYKALQHDTSQVAVMDAIEQKINSGHYFYIPKQKVAAIESKLKSGDIIAIATSKKGLDYAHTGMIQRVDNQSHFLHASLAKKVVTFDTTISEYLQTVSTHIGISVARPLEP